MIFNILIYLKFIILRLSYLHGLHFAFEISVNNLHGRPSSESNNGTISFVGEIRHKDHIASDTDQTLSL